MSKKRIVGQALAKRLSQRRRFLLLMYPVTLGRIHQTAYVFIYPPWSRNHFLSGYDELPEPRDGLFHGGVADFIVEESLELRKEGEVAGWASTAGAKDGIAAMLKVEKLGFVGEFVAERLVEPVCERTGGVAGVVETGDGSLTEHGVGIYVVVGLVDVVHVRSLLPADIRKAYDICRIQDLFDLIEVGVFILGVYGDG